MPTSKVGTLATMGTIYPFVTPLDLLQVYPLELWWTVCGWA